jgi:LacI family transcriptional regulator
MGYQPSQIARSLATRQSTTIGLVVPDISNPFFAQITRGAEDVAYEAGYCLLLANSAENLERETVAFDALWQKEVDGAILCSPRVQGDVLNKQIQRFPAVVLINRDLEEPIPNAVTINVNDQRGAHLVMQEFLHKKRARIAFIAGPPNSVSGQRRLEGYRASLKEAGLAFESQMVRNCAPTIDGGRDAAATLLARNPGINAIFAFNDLTAVGAILACQERGKSVPDDVAVIGADDIYLTDLIHPQLTTLHVNLVHIGRLAMRTMLDIIQVGVSSATLRIDPELIRRESA